MLPNSLGLNSQLHGAMAGPGEYVVDGMVSDLGAQLPSIGSGALCWLEKPTDPHTAGFRHLRRQLL